jgi:CRISPR system Cascade subunit CasD
MPDFLVFRLAGTLASWGGAAVGEYRPSDEHPSRGAILGLLAAALGIERHATESHDAMRLGYGLGVRVDSTGELLRDYHTVQTPVVRRNARYRTRRDELALAERYTVVSNRDYRVGASYLIAIWQHSGAPHSVNALKAALRAPKFVLYLGRKACPPEFPLGPEVVAAPTLRDAFDQYSDPLRQLPPYLAEFVDTSPGPASRYYWDECDSAFSGMTATMAFTRHDEPISRNRWQYAARRELGCFAQEE